MSAHTDFGSSQGSCPGARRQSLYQPLPETEEHSTVCLCSSGLWWGLLPDLKIKLLSRHHHKDALLFQGELIPIFFTRPFLGILTASMK